MSSETIARNCAPTLAGLKAGSLFSVQGDAEELRQAVEQLDQQLSSKGVRAVLLRRKCRDLSLVYLYRERKLGAILADAEVQRFLKEYGYTDFALQPCLERLGERLALDDDFPHDVGVFLDYPLADIQAFIANRGMHCPCSGCWKAYTNVQEAQRKFAAFKRCTSIYCRWVNAGADITRLTLAG